ncbi:MAG: hypothetical protein R2854_15780 [Caldilineaceae bacterium]
MDGTDNFSTRYLLNDACTKLAPALGLHRRDRLYGMTATSSVQAGG